MTTTIFTELRFWLLIVFSLVIPFGIYGILLAKRAISRHAVLILGFVLVVIAGIDVYLLRSLATLAKHTVSLMDDAVFVSEVSIALYILPALFAGIGINMISHILISHLVKAEQRFKDEHPKD
ncbi:hypothetical protein [Aquirhabdus sp.]|uniref:hypothetical protein n=1 Tax=Aquirhabdus sp. TaxID=2824160 RepID=UPI00396C5639